jgi:hypothetical protein
MTKYGYNFPSSTTMDANICTTVHTPVRILKGAPKRPLSVNIQKILTGGFAPAYQNVFFYHQLCGLSCWI